MAYRQGFCGSCRVRGVDGGVDSRGTAAFLDAPDTMLLCTDRAITESITLDL